MKNAVKVMLPLFFAAASFAQNNATWLRIVGVITAPGVQNPVAGIPSGGLPWTTTNGTATVNLTRGTPDGVTSVKGTLVCDPMRTKSLSTRPQFY